MFIFAVIIGFAAVYMSGIHDGGTMVATVISARIISAERAVLFAGAANFTGAVLLGTAVAETMSTDIVDEAYLLSEGKGEIFAFVAAAFLGAIIWDVCTWILKLPSSASHALIGAMIGSGIALMGTEHILWNSVFLKIILAMVLSPLIGFGAGYLSMKLEHKLLKNATVIWNRRVAAMSKISTFLLAFCYGSNDSQKVMGIIAIGIGAYKSAGIQIPVWLVLSCAAMLSLGTVTGGYSMVKTVGTGITKINVKSSFASQLSAATVVIGANVAGIPISATQVVTASVMGVGTESRPRGVNWTATGKVTAAWIFTLPASALIGAGCCLMLQLI